MDQGVVQNSGVNVKSKSKKSVVVSLVLAFIAIAGVSFGVFELLESNKKSAEIADLKEQTSGNNGVDVPGSGESGKDSEDTDKIVRDFIIEFEQSIEKATERGFYKDFDELIPFVKVDEVKTAILLDRSYGIFLVNNNIDHTLTISIQDTIVSELAHFGFEEYSDLGDSRVRQMSYINKASGIVCFISSYTSLGCGHISWLSEERISLANELSEAYYKKSGHYPDTMSFYDSKIYDSPVSSYQRVSASFENAAQLFYRTSPEAEWQYFTGTQAPLLCSEYNTDDLKKAYAGETCAVDYISDKYSTVEP